MTIRWIQDGEPHSAEVYNRPLRDYILESSASAVPTSRKITTTSGITGGGTLGTDLEISGVPASTTTVGVSRFATLSEAMRGTAQDVAISPSVLSQLPNTGFGANQKWTDMTWARQMGVTYVNNTRLPIVAAIAPYDITSTDYIEMWANIDGVDVPITGYSSAPIHGKMHLQGSVIIPAGSRYRVYLLTRSNEQPELRKWIELR